MTETARPLARRLLAELLGPALLAAVVVGSGMFGPVSGRHFNPVVSFVDAAFGGLSRRDALAYLPAQVTGCALGAVRANAMSARAAIRISTHHRASPAHLFAEAIATAGLIVVIFALARTGRSSQAPTAVGAYIGAAYWFTSSTSFANPAITIGRMLSNTFAGIAPAVVLPHTR
ncbi:MAG TPA: aquaporin [Solirubrobacteraceae bacterium]|nr:aquaporin [Solirubrobacteraceae bacterium]